MLITKGGVSFRGQPGLLKYSGISSFGSSDLTKSLISSRPYLSISLSKKKKIIIIIHRQKYRRSGEAAEKSNMAQINPVPKESSWNLPRPLSTSVQTVSPRH